jgi:signal transduction histidine kinase
VSRSSTADESVVSAGAESPELIDRTLQSLEVGVAIAEIGSWEITWANAKFLEWFGPDRESSLSLPTRLPALDLERMGAQLEKGHAYKLEAEAGSGARAVSLDVVVSALSLEAGEFALVECRNVTDRKQLEATLDTHARRVEERTRELAEAREAADEASRAKSAFLANMSHELRTPMNAIIGYSEILTEDAEDEGREDVIPDLNRINAAGQHLLGLINDILDLSKIESGRMDLFLESFDLREMLDESIATLEPLVTKNENRLASDYEENLGEMRADHTKLRQSLFNLVTNASRFTTEGTITLAASRYSSDGEERICLRVTDTGIGMPDDMIERVFEEFTSRQNRSGASKHNHGGTGLGLPISQKFCQMMGGDITVASEVGRGSTFTIDLPLDVGATKVVKDALAEASPERESDDTKAADRN